MADRKPVFTAGAVWSTLTEIAPLWSSSAPRFSLSRMSLIAASIIKSFASGLNKTEIV